MQHFPYCCIYFGNSRLFSKACIVRGCAHSLLPQIHLCQCFHLLDGIRFPGHQSRDAPAGKLAAQPAKQRIVLLGTGMDRAAPRLGPFRAISIQFPAAAAQVLRPLCAAGAILPAGGDAAEISHLHAKTPLSHPNIIDSIAQHPTHLKSSIKVCCQRIGLPK